MIKRAVLFCLLLFASFSTIYAQNTEKTNLTLNNVTLKEFFNAVEKQLGYTFMYNNLEIDDSQQISIKAENLEINDLLKKAFEKKSINYSISGKQIVVTSSKTKDEEKKITGIVYDPNGESIIGVSVQVKGTGIGTTTNIDGKFELSAPKGGILEFNYLGFMTKEVKVGSDTEYIVKMEENTTLLEEIVVVGYGVQKKINLTGSVGTIKGEDALASRPVTNVQELFAGTVPGLNITKGSGAVGSGASMNIRGTSTIGGSSGVLVLIDGFPGNINTLNPNDIESVSVLKDAASSAIYGSRAANGVIIVTTKKGTATDKPIIEVSSSVGIQNPQFMLDFVGSEDYMRMWDQAMINDGKDAVYGAQGLADLKAGKYADVKWYKEIYNKNTLINNDYVAISGKQKNIIYRFSGSYDYQDGNLPNNVYNRYIFKPDMTINVLDNLSFRASIQYTQTQIDNPSGNDTSTPQSQAARNAPISFIKEKNGLYSAGGSMGGNPIAGVQEGGYVENKYKEFMTIFDVVYSPLKNWNIKGSFANYTFDYWKKNRVSTYYLYDADGNVAKKVNQKTSLRQDSESTRRTTVQLTSDYTRAIDENHSITLLGGYSQEYNYGESFWASRDDMPFDGIDVLDIGLSNKQNGGTASDVAVQSVFGRVNYSYQSRYLLEASLRADGSSRFAKGHRWGTFPSFSAGWNISEESFMQNLSWLSGLKLRGSWGELGDAEKVGRYATAQVLTYNPGIYVFNNTLVPGAYNNVSVNPNITWEKSAQTNVGVDIRVLRNKIYLSADYFINIRKNILYAAPVPLEYGLPAPYSNLLKMENRGYELSAGYMDKSGDFSWGIDAVLSSSKNKILDLGGKDFWIEGNSYTKVGGQYQLPYGYIADGLFQNQDEITEAASQFTTLKPGNIRYKNLNNEGGSTNKINGDDRAIISDKVPSNFGFNLHFGFKQFDFSANLYGKFNTLRYMSGYEGWAFYLSNNARPMHKDAWTPENPGAGYPRLTISNTSNDYIYSSYWVRNADYLKLQNMQIGYTFSKKLLGKAKIKDLRMYVSGQNIATITKYEGFDPEGGWYPLSRTWSFGLNLKF